MAIQTIVTAFDFSEPAARALRWAHDLALRTHARLEVVHVYPDWYDPHAEVESIEAPLLGPSGGQEERYLRFLEQEVRTVAQTLVGESATSFGVRIVRGDPVKSLLATAEDLHAGLIVVGATGKGRVQRAILGSVSECVLRSSHVPVALIR